MANLSDTQGVNAADHVFDQVNVALAPIKVHRATFTPAVNPSITLHDEIVSI